MPWHYGRSFHDTRLEDGCPCGKAPCGLVDEERVDPNCTEHPLGRAKTIRQAHYSSDCPGPRGGH